MREVLLTRCYNDLNVCSTYEVGLQEFRYDDERFYDVVWVQWVLCYLKDGEVERFMRDSRTKVKQGGIIVVKENVSEDLPVFDSNDSSMMRSRKAFEKIIRKAGLEIVSHEYQEGFPEELFKVSIWVLRPLK